MICRCASTTLRLFIRSVAQVEISSFASNQSRRSIQSLPTRPCPQVFREHHLAQHRCFSTRSQLRAASSAAAEVEVGDGQGNESNLEQRAPEGLDEAPVQEAAFVDFSLDAIDGILSEAEITTSEPSAVVEEEDSPAGFMAAALARQKDRRERKREQLRDVASERREKVSTPQKYSSDRTQRFEDEEFNPHATFPRLPRISRDSTSPTPLKSRVQDPLKSQSPRRGAENTVRTREHWQIDKDAIRAKYPAGYNPPKRLSPDAIAGIRALHAQMPEEYHTRKLAETFSVSPEAISRILRSKWRPSADEEADRARRWLKRGESVWNRYAEMGVKPPKKWREAGVGKDLPEELLTTRGERKGKKLSRVPPALVTLPKRQNGVFQLGGKRRKASGDDGPTFI